MRTFTMKQVGGGKSDTLILPKPGSLSKAKPIATAADIPNYVIGRRGDYTEMNGKAFSPIKPSQSKTIRCSVTTYGIRRQRRKVH